MAQLNNLLVTGSSRFLNEINGKIAWSNILNTPTIPTVTDTYSATGTAATSGKAVAAALGTLDGAVSGSAGAGKTLTAFSQTDGKVSATFGNISITKSQVSDFPTSLPASNTVDTYTSTDSNPISGKGVAAALGTLDGSVTGTAGAGKTLTAFSQTDGKVSATFGNISITKSQISDFPTIPTVNNGTLTIQKNGTNVQTFTANQSGNVTANITVPTGTAADKNYTTSITSGGTGLPTAGAVYTYVGGAIAASDALIFKGTLGTGGTITALPTTYKVGWTYRVITAGTYAGQTCEIGDLITAIVARSGSGNADADWTVAQTNINGAITSITGTSPISVTGSGSSRTIGISSLKTISIGSASAGTAIPADDITAWTPNTPTEVVSNTVVTGGTTTDIPNISKKTVVTGVTKKTVVTGVTKKTVVTGGTTTNIPNISKKTVVTGVTPATVVTGGTTTNIPNISKKTVVTGVTPATVVTSVTHSGCTLTVSTGSAASVTTGDSVTVGTAIAAYASLTTGAAATVSTGDSVTVGDPIAAYTSLTTGDSVTVTTGDSCTVTTGDSVTVGTPIAAYTSLTTGDACTVTAGTAASLSYTAKSIPNISVTSKTVATGAYN